MKPSILSVRSVACSADILASAVTSIIRLPEGVSNSGDSLMPRTRVNFGPSDNGITAALSREEHDALVAAWRDAEV